MQQNSTEPGQTLRILCMNREDPDHSGWPWPVLFTDLV